MIQLIQVIIDPIPELICVVLLHSVGFLDPNLDQKFSFEIDENLMFVANIDRLTILQIELVINLLCGVENPPTSILYFLLHISSHGSDFMGVVMQVSHDSCVYL
jgi:hypothetical protein